MKPCSRCRQVLPLSDFHRRSRTPDGLSYLCKACVAQRRQYPAVEQRLASCRRCGVEFSFTSTPGRPPVRCELCRPIARRLPVGTSKRVVCRWCGKYFLCSLQTGYGNRKYCKPECRASAVKRYKAEHHKANRRKVVVRRYGITVADFNRMFEAQGGICAINNCGNPATHIDHDHSCCPTTPACGKCVRGLLCDRCNPGLGAFRDDPLLLVNAALYLESHKESQ
jgi:hypothetical protein